MKRFSVLTGFLLAALTAFAAEPIKLVGSDLLAETTGAGLKSFAAGTDRELLLEMRGSRLGLDALKAGKGDLGLLVFAPDEPKPGPELVARVVGYMTAVFAVPESIPLTQLHFGQLAGVFGASEINSYKRWSDLGVSGDWSVRSITAVATSRRVGLAYDLVRYGVFQTPEFKSTVTVFDEKARAVSRIGGEEGGLLLLPSPPAEDSKLKVLLIAKGERDVAYGPTSENLHTGDYPLRLPVYVVFRQADAPRLNFLLRHLLADETAPSLIEAGVVPLPVQARNQLVFELENMK
jgi:phosphate transport system substrate-binding protein